MNLDRYEKIDGREALRRLAGGERIYSDCDYSYELGTEPYPSVKRFIGNDETGGMSDWYSANPLTLHDLCGRDWYIKKPFDVRQAMLDRPNEWVAAYTNFEDKWFKVGFDVKRMRPVRSFMDSDAKVNLQDTRVFVIELADLDLCIPIEDVPEEATR